MDGAKQAALIETFLYVPDLEVNLLSLAAITEAGLTVHFIESQVSLKKSDAIVLVGERIGRTLYHLAITVYPPYGHASRRRPLHLSPYRLQRLAHTSIKNSTSFVDNSNKLDNLSIPMYAVQCMLLHQGDPNTLFFSLTTLVVTVLSTF